MTVPFSEVAKNQMLDALTIDRVRLHSGDPGPSGTDNALGSLTAATFSAASGGIRELSSEVTLTGLGAGQGITHFSVWLNSGTVFKGSGEVTGDGSANAEGEYLLTTDTTLSIN